MLDLNLFREDRDGNLELIRESQRRRFADVELVDRVVEFDREWRHRQFEFDNLRKDANAATKQVKQLKAAGQDATEAIQRSVAIQASAGEKTKEVQEAKERLDSTLGKIGNLVHNSVPISNNEDDE